MAKYIDKDALVAEIEKAIDSPAPSHDQQCSWEDGYWCGLYTAEGIIDTLEVKEVDLEKEIQVFSMELAMRENDGNWENDIKTTARYFFELGLKVQKGE